MLSSDAKLVHRTLQGDNTAFDQLVQQYQPSLFNRALSEVHSWSEAEDLVQEAFLHAYQHLETLRTPDKFSGWVYRITCNLCHDAVRKRRLRFELLRSSGAGFVSDGSVMPDCLVDGHETADGLLKVIASLPDNSRPVFLLYLRGWTYRSISVALGLSVSTVSGRIQRSKRQVKERFLSVCDSAIDFSDLHLDWDYLRQGIEEMSTGALDATISVRCVALN